jgi:hypothetical protein
LFKARSKPERSCETNIWRGGALALIGPGVLFSLVAALQYAALIMKMTMARLPASRQT